MENLERNSDCSFWVGDRPLRIGPHAAAGARTVAANIALNFWVQGKTCKRAEICDTCLARWISLEDLSLGPDPQRDCQNLNGMRRV